jgi:hypothetical protein
VQSAQPKIVAFWLPDGKDVLKKNEMYRMPSA